MNKQFSLLALVILAAIILPGCGIKQKSSLLKISHGITKNSVESKMGQPDEIHCPIVDKNNHVIDIWEYNLATTDENQWTKNFCVTLLCCLVFLPLVIIPACCMDSPYHYDNYFLKFDNDLLVQWGSRRDIEWPTQTQQAKLSRKEDDTEEQ